MFRSRLLPGALALALSVIPNAFAATDADLAQIRSEIRTLKESYEARIQALEKRLKDAEAVAAPAQAARSTAPALPVSTSSSRASAFNPTISAILSGTYAHLSKDPRTFAIPGFTPDGEIGPGRRGFGLGESEVVLSANVDPSFAGTLILAVTPEDSIAVEEAYGRWLTAPFGLSPKFGRFLSGVGYLNEQHPHVWDFADAPLAYQAFLGGRYSTDGVQVKWIAPVDHYVELGAEVGNGDAYPGSERNHNGAGSGAFYVHTGGDIGSSQSWRAGVSHLRTRSEDEFGATAASRLSVADFVWKYAPNGAGRENVKVQGEYFSGRIREATRQGGWYVQGVYQFMPEWRVGARYDRLDPNGVDDAAWAPRKTSVMLDYNPSEFTRIRLQFARSELASGLGDNQFFIQYILSLGAHSAHRY